MPFVVCRKDGDALPQGAEKVLDSDNEYDVVYFNDHEVKLESFAFHEDDSVTMAKLHALARECDPNIEWEVRVEGWSD